MVPFASGLHSAIKELASKIRTTITLHCCPCLKENLQRNIKAMYFSMKGTMFHPVIMTLTTSVTCCVLSCRMCSLCRLLHWNCYNREMKPFFICKEPPPRPSLGPSLDNLWYENPAGQLASQTISEGQNYFHKLFIKVRFECLKFNTYLKQSIFSGMF